MQVEKQIRCFNGTIQKLVHDSPIVKTPMRLNVFLPPKPENAPVIVYLSGLTCTGDNALEKGGFLGFAAQRNIAMVFPDTSPRTSEANTVDGEHDSWDLGSGAGFYIDATQQPWSKNYQMESYTMDLIQNLLPKQFPQLDWSRKSLCGHSMGGHGALTLFLKKPELFKTVSCFAPITNPTQVPWGQKAFNAYLNGVEQGTPHDALEICRKQGENLPKASVLIDVGDADPFWDQLKVNEFTGITADTPLKVELRVQKEYDHSYFFVSTFAKDHIEHHFKAFQ